MADKNFASILDRPAADFEAPPTLPQGTYLFATHGMPEHGESSQKKTKQLTFLCNVIQAGEDVDPEELAAFGPVTGKQMKAVFYLTESAAFMLREFLTALGLDEAEYESMGQMIDDTPGKQFLGTVTHEGTKDGKRIFARITGWAPAE